MNGFTGDFCEFKTEQNHLLFVTDEYVHGEIYYTPLLFNADGRLIEENVVIDEQAGAGGSCSTMLNGEAVIFGGWFSNIYRQVNLKYVCISLNIFYFRFRLFLNAQ